MLAKADGCDEWYTKTGVSGRVAPEEMFYVGRIPQTVCPLSRSFSLSFSLSKAVHVHHSILSLFLHILLFGFKLSLIHGHMRVCVVLVQYLYMRNE